MQVERLKIPDVVVFTPTIYNDSRGRFMETFRTNEIAESVGGGINFVQGNCSTSLPWVLRGLHYQTKNGQGKLVQALSGQIFDVAVDLRAESPSYGKWVGKILDWSDGKSMYTPPGFAHGFLVLSQPAVVYYQCTTLYVEEYNRSLNWNDPGIAIRWPIQQGRAPVMSNKDRAAPFLRDIIPIAA